MGMVYYGSFCKEFSSSWVGETLLSRGGMGKHMKRFQKTKT